MRCALPLALAAGLATPASAQPTYVNFEAGPVRPLAISGPRLYAVNTPDDRLEIYDIASGIPRAIASVPVGLSPVAVAVEGDRAWVVNHLSDSVSIVDLTELRVIDTLLVGDEPSDMVFAAGRAYVTTAHRGQSHPVPRGDFDVPGIGRADVWVFDRAGALVTIVELFGDRPRALAVSPDGSRVYAAVFHSGNRTTTLNQELVAVPPPYVSHEGAPAPPTGLIVRFDPERAIWTDELGRDHSPLVRFDLPDEDVFVIDALADPPARIDAFSTVGTVLYAMAVNPVTGALYVSNTEARNEVRFEGPGTYLRSMRAEGPFSVRGHLHEARITVIDRGTVTPRHLNPHIRYDERPTPETRERSLATPLGMAVSADGRTIYLAAFGSSRLAVLDALEVERGAIAMDPIELGAAPLGPTGVVLDERGYLYVATRFDNSIATIELASREVIARTRMHTPEPISTIVGRPLLYDARFTSSNGEASCASCHVFGDTDGLAWDLGNPDGDLVANPNPRGPITLARDLVFHPMKGPMLTQSLRGIATHGPMHWRGDRTGGNADPPAPPLDEVPAFLAFAGAFESLLGRDEGPLDEEHMRRLAAFALAIEYPPNPIRQLDGTLRDDEQRGFEIFTRRENVDGVTRCNGCHVLHPASGLFGTNGETTFDNQTQELKIPHLRGLYQRVGMFGMAAIPFHRDSNGEHTGPQVRGFGFLHDGSVDTITRHLHGQVFRLVEDERRRLEAYLMVFDTALAPIVGQQVTTDAHTERVALLMDRATLGECDLVARGAGRGWLYRPANGMFTSDRAGEAEIDETALFAIASPVTFTCAPPGSGARALDRDEDGVLDADDPDPASRAFIAIPSPERPPLPMRESDAGMDAGTDAGVVLRDRPHITCGCRASSARPPLLWLLLFALAARSRRARHTISSSGGPPYISTAPPGSSGAGSSLAGSSAGG